MKTTLALIALVTLGLSSCTKKTSNDEKNDLTFLREEEKLAHDVYVYAFKKHNQSIFNNISSSEQNHMEQVLTLLNKYDIPDPVANEAEGVFKDAKLQQLYNQLTAKSDSSLVKALEVGAIIEDLDINDIKGFYAHTSNSKIIDVYDALSCGSRNHLRSFTSQLSANNSTYKPQFITLTEYNSIISSSNEKCGK
ncbi:MAG: DUF2202 domain-containing protein [Bacteroidia bacterium]